MMSASLPDIDFYYKECYRRCKSRVIREFDVTMAIKAVFFDAAGTVFQHVRRGGGNTSPNAQQYRIGCPPPLNFHRVPVYFLDAPPPAPFLSQSREKPDHS